MLTLYCSHCGYKLPADICFCPNCGTALSPAAKSALRADPDGADNDTEIKQTNGVMIDYVSQFIGKNAIYYLQSWNDNSKQRLKLNWAALFLSFFWLGYRKMYKPILLGAGGYLVFILILVFCGYTFFSPAFFDPALLLYTGFFHLITAFFGNLWYKRYTMKHVTAINRKNLSIQQKQSIQKNSGRTSFPGVILATTILIAMFIFGNGVNDIQNSALDAIRYGHFEEVSGMSVNDVFKRVFENGNWTLAEAYGDTSIVSYHGTIIDDDKQHDVVLTFYTTGSLKEFELDTVTVDGEELDTDDAQSFMDYLFEKVKFQ